jgi:ABC-type multidrug transport system fused ATPase/permease subunit
VLRNVSFEISGGKCIGVVGTTRAGKTTLVSLLSRFYDPTEGRILLDGVDLREYRLADMGRPTGRDDFEFSRFRTQQRTTFLITHRPAPLARCDLILKIDKGRVADEATEGSRQMVTEGL